MRYRLVYCAREFVVDWKCGKSRSYRDVVDYNDIIDGVTSDQEAAQRARVMLRGKDVVVQPPRLLRIDQEEKTSDVSEVLR